MIQEFIHSNYEVISVVFVLLDSIGVIIGIVLFGGGGYLAYNAYQLNKGETNKTTTTAKITPKSGTITLDSLLEKMKTYQNYQLDMKITGQTIIINQKILRVGEKQVQIDEDISIIMSYYDFSKKKLYLYDKSSDTFLEEDLKDDLGFWQFGNPEFYFRKWPLSLTPKGEETIEGEKVKVFTASSDTVS